MTRIWRMLVAAVFVAAYATEALARPGGGQMFGGGGGGGFDGGGDSVEGFVIYIIIWLVIEYPVVGIPVAVVAIAVWATRQTKAKKRNADWSAGISGGAPIPGLCRRSRLEKLREIDPDYSQVLFEDFLYNLYSEAHRRRGSGELDQISAYLGPDARRSLANINLDVSGVEGIIIGGMRFVAVSGIEPPEEKIFCQVIFETNFRESRRDGDKEKQETFYQAEQWTLVRSANVRSRPPDRVGVFACPNCGGALSKMDEGVCGFCGTRVDSGNFDWVVTAIQVRSRKLRPPGVPLQAHGEYDPGLDNPTVMGIEAVQRFRALCERDPKVSQESFEARVKEVFHAISEAWSSLKWEQARPFATDRLFQSQQYWIDAYKSSGLRNVIEEAQITTLELSATTTDKWFDAVTMRVYAKSRDYTVETATGRVVGGNKKVLHGYSEYWTFIRGRNAKGPGEPGKCPNCGAGLAITTGGTCEYCDAKIASGDFDWVLSRIEQDQTYTC